MIPQGGGDIAAEAAAADAAVRVNRAVSMFDLAA